MADADLDRHWNCVLQRWVYPDEAGTAIDAAELAIREYYNERTDDAEAWLLRAYEANQKENAK